VTERPAVGAAVDLGSNSVHLLVAAIAGHTLRPIVDESAFLGLGAAVDGAAHLGEATTARLLETLQAYAATARSLGARHVTLLGTEPLRRAADAARVVALVEERTGVPLHVLTHEEEAYLTLVGVTEGQPVTRETLVLDIGGGSSEFVAVGPRSPARAAGLRLGSNGLTRRVDPADPPTADDLARLRDHAREAMSDALADAPRHVLAVGGTATNLLKVTAAGSADRRLTRPRLDEAVATITAQPAATITERYAVNPVRARLLAAGAAIVEAVLEHYGVPELTVSDAGLRDGAILVADHAGRAWRDRLAELAHGWRV
jgi:exopolyphosphatase/guanosine-5'-triphosphate,3'-diphosphate pyrophosphatase